MGGRRAARRLASAARACGAPACGQPTIEWTVLDGDTSPDTPASDTVDDLGKRAVDTPDREARQSPGTNRCHDAKSPASNQYESIAHSPGTQIRVRRHVAAELNEATESHRSRTGDAIVANEVPVIAARNGVQATAPSNASAVVNIETLRDVAASVSVLLIVMLLIASSGSDNDDIIRAAATARIETAAEDKLMGAWRRIEQLELDRARVQRLVDEREIVWQNEQSEWVSRLDALHKHVDASISQQTVLWKKAVAVDAAISQQAVLWKKAVAVDAAISQQTVLWKKAVAVAGIANDRSSVAESLSREANELARNADARSREANQTAHRACDLARDADARSREANQTAHRVRDDNARSREANQTDLLRPSRERFTPILHGGHPLATRRRVARSGLLPVHAENHTARHTCPSREATCPARDATCPAADPAHSTDVRSAGSIMSMNPNPIATGKDRSSQKSRYELP